MRALSTVFVAILCACSPRPASAAPRASAGNLGQLSSSLEALAARVGPAVVKIEVAGAFNVQQRAATAADLAKRERASGSGVIVDPSGYILTNHHVVAGAKRVNVVLGVQDDGAKSILKRRVVLPAQVVGTDKETDLAVLKIQAASGAGYAHLPLGDSDQVGQGAIVLAFGSPHGLRNSVSMGVVSSPGRQLQAEHPVVFIQSDATVNPGNSGGPLVDTRGRVIGINSMILSRSGGSDGLSFAIPSNIASYVYKQIRASGHVKRGLIGVNAQTIDQSMAKALGLAVPWGVILADVYPRGPAALAGLEIGDVILKLDGKRMENGRQFEVNLYRKPVGDRVAVEFSRDGKRQKLSVVVAERNESLVRITENISREAVLLGPLGILAVDLKAYGDLRRFPVRVRSGVVVVGVGGDSPSLGPQLAPGDIIHQINRQDVGDVDALRAALKGLKGPVVLQVERKRQLHLLTFDL